MKLFLRADKVLLLPRPTNAPSYPRAGINFGLRPYHVSNFAGVLGYVLKQFRTMAEGDYLHSGCQQAGLRLPKIRKVPNYSLY